MAAILACGAFLAPPKAGVPSYSSTFCAEIVNCAVGTRAAALLKRAALGPSKLARATVSSRETLRTLAPSNTFAQVRLYDFAVKSNNVFAPRGACFKIDGLVTVDLNGKILAGTGCENTGLNGADPGDNNFIDTGVYLRKSIR